MAFYRIQRPMRKERDSQEAFKETGIRRAEYGLRLATGSQMRERRSNRGSWRGEC